MKQVLTAITLMLLVASSGFAQTAQKRIVAVAVSVSGEHLPAREMFVGKMEAAEYRFQSVREITMTDAEVGKLYNGNADLIRKAVAVTKASVIIAGTLIESYSQSEVAGHRLTTCHLIFTYRIFDSQGEEVLEDSIQANGAGFTNPGALDVATDHLVVVFDQKTKRMFNLAPVAPVK